MSQLQPSTRTELKDWCLRRLGYPVIDINVDDDQAEDRIEEALQFFTEFLYPVMQRVYLKHKVTAEDKARAKTNSTETVTNQGDPTTTLNGSVLAAATSITLTDVTAFGTSGTLTISADDTPNAAETVAWTAKAGNILTCPALANAHADGAVITLDITATWETGQNYVPIPDSVMSVLRILPFSDKGTLNMFDVRYQLRLNDLYDFSDVSVIYYQMVMWQLDLLDMILIGEKPIQFSVHERRLYVDMDWVNDIETDDYLVIECYRKLNPTTFTDIYNDFFLKKYATALIKRQWGQNLSKFNGVTMLGGVTMNGEMIYSQAQEEINTLEDQGRLTYEEPLMFDIG